MRQRHLWILCVLLIAAAIALTGQVVITSTVIGNVTDPQKAVVPDAMVVLKNIDTGVEWKTTTNSVGDFQFPNLIAGHYKVQVEKAGFSTATSTAIALQNGVSQRVNFTLTVGQATEVVDVTSAAAIVKTEDANVSEVIQQKFVRDLPIQGRNFLNYAQVAPMFNSGVGDTGRISWGLASATMTGGQQLNVGGTESGVGYYIDGLNNNDNWVEGPVTNVNMDAVQEVKAEVVNYSAEYGRDVGQISLTTKSGGNALHGTVYDFFQNAGLNANDAFSKATLDQNTRSPYHQNQYGFTVGGPVYIPKLFNGKNKMFFFGSFERLRNRGQSIMTAYVPTAAERTGDFSEWLTRFPDNPGQGVIYDPYSYDPATQTRTPYTNNVITNPDPRALEYLSHFPMPNWTPSDSTNLNNWIGRTTNGLDNDNYSARVDYNLSQRDSLYFRFSYDHGTKINQGGLIPELTLGNGPVHTVKTYQWHWVHTFGSSFNNEVNFSMARGRNSNEESSAINKYMKTTWFSDLFKNVVTPGNGGFSSYDLGMLQIPNDGLFSLWFGGDGLFGPLGMGPGEYWYQHIPIYQLSDNAGKTIGKHTLKFGFYWSRRDERDNDVVRSLGVGGGGYTSRSAYAADGSGWNSLAEFETGAVAEMTQRTPLASGDGSLWFRMPEYAAFVNDTFQVTPKLTVNYGVRYDVAVPAYSVDHYWGVLDMNYPGYRMVMPGLTPGIPARLYPADKNNFAPRFGFAYRPFDKTVIRGGYGIFYETGRFKFLDQMFWNSPGYGGATYRSADYAADPHQVYFTLNDVFPVANTVQKGDWPVPLGDQGGLLYNSMWTTTVDKDSSTTPYLQRWSLDIQRELGSKAVATVGYVGSKGTKLTMAEDLNLPPQGVYMDYYGDFLDARPLTAQYPDRWDAIMAVHHNRNNNYNAFNAQVKTQAWHGLTSQIAYTWSKQLDTYFGEGGYDNNHAIGGQWHPEWSYGESDANHPHRFVAAFTYELPGKSLTNSFLRYVVGGWQISSITTFESGNPYTVWNGDTSSHDFMGDVPDRVCNGNLSGGDRGFYRYFNTSCFVNPPSIDPGNPDVDTATHRGNSGRNIVRGPGINNWDMSLAKSFRTFGEGRELQFRADAFNAFNHTQWSSIDTWNDTGRNATNSWFGRVTGARPGRHMQFALKFVF